VHAGMILYPAARFAHIVGADAALAARYAAPLEKFRGAVAESLAAYEDQWHERIPAGAGAGESEGYYTEPIAGAAPLPLNMMNTLGRVMLEMNLAQPNAHYLDRVTKLARFMKNRMVRRSDGAFQWAYRPGIEPPYDKGAEDLSHAAINVDFAVRCYQANVVFNREDMDGLVKTFCTKIYRGGGKFADRIDGTGDRNLYADTVAWWGELASVDRRVAALIHERYMLRPQPAGGPGGLLAAATLAKCGY